MSRWIRLAHFDELDPEIKVGLYVSPNSKVGKVGDTGYAQGSHVHIDGTFSKPAWWTQYVIGWKVGQVAKTYFNTEPFWKLILPYSRMYVTSKFLQWDGRVFHTGGDLNVAPSDRGLIAYAGVYGRVQYLAKSSVLRRLMPEWIRKKLNSGWGNFLWIELDESKYN